MSTLINIYPGISLYDSTLERHTIRIICRGEWREMNSGEKRTTPFFLEKLWMKFVSDITCTGTVLPVVACHTSSLPVQVILLSTRCSCFHCKTQYFVTSGSCFLTNLQNYSIQRVRAFSLAYSSLFSIFDISPMQNYKC